MRRVNVNKNFISSLKDEIEVLKSENAQLRDKISLFEQKEVNGSLKSDAIHLDKVREDDQEFIKRWVNGYSWGGNDNHTEADSTESDTAKSTPITRNAMDNSRIKFLDKMFNIILDNLVSEKYKFKLHNADWVLGIDYAEVKKIAKMTEYQKNEMMNEKRINEFQMFMALLDPTVKQFNYFTNFSRREHIKVRDKMTEAVAAINKGRNLTIEALTYLDSMHHWSSQMSVFNSMNSQKAAHYFTDNKLGYDYTAPMIWKYNVKEREVEYSYDSRLVLSKRTNIPGKSDDMIRYKVKIPYHESKIDLNIN